MKIDVNVQHDFKHLEKLLKQLKSGLYVDIGILASEASNDDGLTIAGIGAVHEKGTLIAGRGRNTRIPKRSFIRDPLFIKKKDIQKAAEGVWQKALETNNFKMIFSNIGIAAENAQKEAFKTRGYGTWEPNAESTIRQKGSDSPLIDEGALRNAIAHKVGQSGS